MVNNTPFNIPSTDACDRLILEMGMMDHIADHSRMVCRVALFLVDQLSDRGNGLNRPLIQAAALLHDITKTRSFQTGENHAATGKELLTGLGYPEVGDIVGQHVRLEAYPTSGPVTEAEIVNYSDKRVLHDRVVPLDRRMAYIQEKYGQNPELDQRIAELRDRSRELEKRIFMQLPISPVELTRRLTKSRPAGGSP